MIAPVTSEAAQDVVPIFVRARKVVVTPTATSADLFRAFASAAPQFVWRPLESDIAQVRVLLRVAARGGASSVALVAGDDAYGNTFFQWFGFLAAELGLRVTYTTRYETGDDCKPSTAEALASAPDTLVAAPSGVRAAVCMARERRKRGRKTRLLFSDTAENQGLVDALGARANGIEGVGPAPNPRGGFASAYRARFGVAPGAYAASVYDAVLLLAYGLRQSGGETGSRLATAIGRIVNGGGARTGWDAREVARTLDLLGAGERPSIHGAVGPWDFDRVAGLELVASTYELWRIEEGRFARVRYMASSQPRRGRSAAATRPAAAPRLRVAGDGGGRGRKGATWALLVAASDGWENYRHQADVLAQYQVLRAQGVPDDHIVLVMADDLAGNRRNPWPGTVPYSVHGPDVRRGARVDYPLAGMTARRLMRILRGRRSAATPEVIASGPRDDIYVYLAGHGNDNGVYLGLGEPRSERRTGYSAVSPRLLRATVDGLAKRGRYRRLVAAVEACQAGALGEGLDAPGALLIAAASPVEDSLSVNYDPAARTWLADQFSYQLWKALSRRPDQPLDTLYQGLYDDVAGSHVSVYGRRFGDPRTISMGEILRPG